MQNRLQSINTKLTDVSQEGERRLEGERRRRMEATQKLRDEEVSGALLARQAVEMRI